MSLPSTRVRRKPDRASYDFDAVAAVFDTAPLVQVATVRDGCPVVLPMVHGRLDDQLFVHGSPAAGLFRDFRRGSAVCVTATLYDGLVLARSARRHSVNYRSAVAYGVPSPVTGPGELRAALRALVDHAVPGRWAAVREPDDEELRDIQVWRIPLDHASVKVRATGPIDLDSDRDLPVWAGHLPARIEYATSVPAADLPPGLDPPAVRPDPGP
jgi:nitroimidazol reductase NimA-like FMN-containing flavoprotein (pyridoxamine 5'-phosphate oxidase superfamily)